ncbi:MAG: zinc ribbon domain-containing protein [Bacteroidaceae bacterium]|nr:zinc ribbon domain-containing protein [Bacteroidaceae bacterium]
MKQCPNCGSQISDDSHFCNKCGKEIPQGTVCPHCGASVEEGDAFCHSCGKSIKEEVVPTDPSKKKCSHCGVSVNDGDAFCQNCGKSLYTHQNEQPIVFNKEGKTKSGSKKYLPYVLGAIVLIALCCGGWWFFKNMSETALSQLDNTAKVKNTDNSTIESDNISVISDYDGRTIHQGEYVFEAILTDATLEKIKKNFTIKIEGNKVSIPSEGKTMTGFIYNDDLGIDVFYDYGDDLHYLSMTLKPNDKEGKEWEGEYQPTGILYDVVLKLKECKFKGDVVKVTKERTADDNSETAEVDVTPSYRNSNTSSSSSKTFANEQYVTMYLVNQSFRDNDGLTIRFDGSLRMYIDGDYAGVVSVLRYSSTSALLRYGGGLYGEGKITVQIVGDKLQLTDILDGTVYYQR